MVDEQSGSLKLFTVFYHQNRVCVRCLRCLLTAFRHSLTGVILLIAVHDGIDARGCCDCMRVISHHSNLQQSYPNTDHRSKIKGSRNKPVSASIKNT